MLLPTLLALTLSLSASATPAASPKHICKPPTTSQPTHPIRSIPPGTFAIIASGGSINSQYFSVQPGENGITTLTSHARNASLFTIDSQARLIEMTPSQGFILNQDPGLSGAYVYFNSEQNLQENAEAIASCRVEKRRANGTCALRCGVNGGNVVSWWCNGGWYLTNGPGCGEQFEPFVVGRV